jgi:hypothetical protein
MEVMLLCLGAVLSLVIAAAPRYVSFYHTILIYAIWILKINFLSLNGPFPV